MLISNIKVYLRQKRARGLIIEKVGEFGRITFFKDFTNNLKTSKE
jgi:hypothetical protein